MRSTFMTSELVNHEIYEGRDGSYPKYTRAICGSTCKRRKIVSIQENGRMQPSSQKLLWSTNWNDNRMKSPEKFCLEGQYGPGAYWHLVTMRIRLRYENLTWIYRSRDMGAPRRAINTIKQLQFTAPEQEVKKTADRERAAGWGLTTCPENVSVDSDSRSGQEFIPLSRMTRLGQKEELVSEDFKGDYEWHSSQGVDRMRKRCAVRERHNKLHLGIQGGNSWDYRKKPRMGETCPAPGFEFRLLNRRHPTTV